MGHCYKAQAASEKSGEYVKAKDKAAWLALFAEDAVIQDPVGVSPLDETGLGHKGPEAISAFWDMVIATGTMERFDIASSHPAGDECANIIDMRNVMGDMAVEQRMVVVYTANEAGLITSLKAYWDYKALAEKMVAA